MPSKTTNFNLKQTHRHNNNKTPLKKTIYDLRNIIQDLQTVNITIPTLYIYITPTDNLIHIVDTSDPNNHLVISYFILNILIFY